MAQRKTAKLRINGDGKFDAVDADGEIVYADIANGLRAVRIISSLEGDGIDTLLLETYEGKSKRRFNIKAKDLSIESSMRSELLNNQYYIGANFSRYLMNFLIYNLQAVQNQSRITYRHRSLGFYMDEHGEQFFLLGKTKTAKGVSYYVDQDKMQFKAGSSESYMELINHEILPYKSTQLGLVLGLSSVTASYLKDYADSQTLVVNLCGPSSSGKTTMAQFMGSLWANPRISNDGIVKSFSNTHTARFNNIVGYNGVPIIFDDLTAGYRVNRSQLVYELSQGEARQRAKDYGDNDHKEPWSGVSIITSETPILKDSENRQGLIARVIDTDNITWTESSDHAKRIKKSIQEHHGHLGPKFASKFMTLSDDEIKAKYDDTYASMDQAVQRRDNLTDRILSKLAIIQTTALLIKEHLNLDLDLDYIQNTLISFEESGIEDRHIGLKALEHIKLYIQEHHRKFDKWVKDGAKTDSAGHEIHGVLTFSGNTVHVLIPSNIVKRILNEHKIFEYETVLKYWGDEDIIQKQSGRHTVNVSALDTRAVRFVFDKHEDTILPWSHDPREKIRPLSDQEPEEFVPDWEEPTDEEIFEQISQEEDDSDVD